MLKFLRETLSIGDFVEVETSTGLVRAPSWKYHLIVW